MVEIKGSGESAGGGKASFRDFHTPPDELNDVFPDLGTEVPPVTRGKMCEPDGPYDERKTKLIILNYGPEIPDERPAISEYDVLTDRGIVTSIGGVRRDGTLTRANQKITRRVR